jgi:hypothetical protein
MLFITSAAVLLAIVAVRGVYSEVAIDGVTIVLTKWRRPPRAIPRSALRSIGSLPFGRWYLVWLKLGPHEPVQRAFFFSLSPHPVRMDAPSSAGPG